MKITYFLPIALLIFAYSCKEQKPVQTENVEIKEVEVEDDEINLVQIEAESTSSTEGLTINEKGSGNDVFLINESQGVAFAYDVEIPVAGRYRFEIEADNIEGETSVWMEDYTDNTDGRTYNVTGSVSLVNGETSKDGSPLNSGVHKMKLHVENGKANIDKFRFVLMKELIETPVTLTQNMEGEEWEVVWADEFEGEGLPDETKWTYDFGDWGWGNNELQYYTKADLANARLEDGNLVIEAKKDEDGNWTSARLTTREKETFVYGRIEFRAKVPVEKGNWSAGWTLGDAYVDEKSWPYCGEIDIMESVGYETDNESGKGKAHASVHCGAYYFKLGNQPTSTIEVDDLKNEYHTYRIDWSPESIVAYVDDEQYFEFSDTQSELTWPFNQAQNIILNLAMGGGWGGAQGMDESVTSQKLYVDYVRVYQKK